MILKTNKLDSLNLWCTKLTATVAVLLTVLALVSLFKNTKNQVFHEDEYQHTHLAWNTFRGKIVYRDFDDSHGPLSTLIYNFFLKIRPKEIASVSTLYYLRQLNAVVVLVTGLFLGLCVFQMTQLKRAGVLALFLYLASPAIRMVAFRIRPDCYVAFFSVLSLYFCLRQRHLFMGLALGLAMGFHAKFLPIAACILIVAFLLRRQRKIFASRIFLGFGFALFIIVAWLWYHRALSMAFLSVFVSGFRTAYSRLILNTESTQLIKDASRVDIWMVTLVCLALFLWSVRLLRKRTQGISPLWILAGTYTVSSLAFLFAPVWGHALAFVIPTGLAFVVASLFTLPKWEGIMGVLGVVLGAFLLFTEMGQSNRGKELQELQLASLERALSQTKRSDPVFYVWTSRCPAHIFNEDPSPRWTHPFRQEGPKAPIRMLPPINYLSFHPMFLNLLDLEERTYIEKHFQVEGCFWSRR